MKILCVVLGFVVLLLIYPALDHSGRDAPLRRTPVQHTADQLHIALKAYQSEYGSYPTGDYAKICRVLCGENPKQIEFFERDPKRLNAQGEIIDPWGTPYRIDFSPGPVAPRIQSAGKNRTFQPRAKDSDDYYSWQE